ncbi:DUF2927 domain-containing protein [Paracoccus tegillarcae]|uniref:DUF2927 domain-containing protein n=1 Tax=Paracoccus tegillarcae TaxID=1529068 RepID=A0A2K9EGJ2_9RHOB|nr:DUF2927 domain-containing protein [Paracoccus tegillarcae]AUH34063.1 hypothetical protein CUV01_12260 [Paracoccus tegillarcae]
MTLPGLHTHTHLASCATAALLLLTLCLAACTDTQPDTPRTEPSPEVQPEPSGPTEAELASQRQAEIRQARADRARATNANAVDSDGAGNMGRYLQGVEADLIARGKLRTDRVPGDAPFTADDLARNFIQIALRDEYGRDGQRLVADHHAAPLRRWQRPIGMQIEWGPSSDIAAQRRDRAEIASFAARLARLSGHEVGLVGAEGNFAVLILTEAERRAIGPRLQQLVPGIPRSDIAALRDLDAGNFCAVFAYSRGPSAVYVNAVALIRAELPPRLRSSCIHEELAQGMGLANDSPGARPSIFNDDEEFALLTQHDELLLRILYDRRLRPGMSEAEATPIVRQIARELVGTGI